MYIAKNMLLYHFLNPVLKDLNVFLINCKNGSFYLVDRFELVNYIYFFSLKNVFPIMLYRVKCRDVLILINDSSGVVKNRFALMKIV